MPDRYNVLWTESAQSDLISIIEYISINNPLNAKEIFLKFKSSASKLYFFPKRGRIVPELKEQGITIYRELVIKPWRVIYKIKNKNIYILSVIDSRRNVEDILLSRFIDKDV
jgi:plasmid stabilization system protein ParE